MITAEEFYKEYCNKRITTGALNGHERLEVMIEFAKLHVEAALEVVTDLNRCEPNGMYSSDIIDAYPLENIK